MWPRFSPPFAIGPSIFLKAMKTLIKIGLLLLTYAVLLSSCKPEDFESSQSQVTLLTDGLVKNWQVTKVRRGTTEVPQSTCLLNDHHRFYADGKYVLDEGATRCRPTDPQQLAGNWGLSEQQLTIREKGRADVVLDIQTLTRSQLVVLRRQNGETVEITYLAE